MKQELVDFYIHLAHRMSNGEKLIDIAKDMRMPINEIQTLYDMGQKYYNKSESFKQTLLKYLKS